VPCHAAQEFEVNVCTRILELLNAGTDVRFGEWTANDIEVRTGRPRGPCKPHLCQLEMEPPPYKPWKPTL
jgi:hypothetical protein